MKQIKAFLSRTVVAFGVAVLGFFYMMGKKKREEDRDRKD